MQDADFDLVEFRDHLQQLEKELKVGIEKDPDYQGEVDEVIEAIKRLNKELQDTKYQQILPDLFLVINFLGMVDAGFDEDLEEFEEEFEDEDEE